MKTINGIIHKTYVFWYFSQVEVHAEDIVTDDPVGTLISGNQNVMTYFWRFHWFTSYLVSMWIWISFIIVLF